MSLLNSTGERLRRATQLWHTYLEVTGQRFDLAQFLQDPALEEQIIVKALASSHGRLAELAREWLRDTGQPVPVVVPRVVAGAAKSAAPREEPPKPPRYLRGVR